MKKVHLLWLRRSSRVRSPNDLIITESLYYSLRVWRVEEEEVI